MSQGNVPLKTRTTNNLNLTDSVFGIVDTNVSTCIVGSVLENMNKLHLRYLFARNTLPAAHLSFHTIGSNSQLPKEFAKGNIVFGMNSHQHEEEEDDVLHGWIGIIISYSVDSYIWLN